jgi:hypothetical protein
MTDILDMYDGMRMALYLCDLTPPKPYLQCNGENYQINPSHRTFYKIPDQYSSTLPMSSKTKTDKGSQSRGT